jgi:hypothetical protein
MSVSVGLHRWDRFPEKNGPWMGWRMAKLRKMGWLALAGLALRRHSLALSGADPAFKRRKHESSPDKSTETPATGHGSGSIR